MSKQTFEKLNEPEVEAAALADFSDEDDYLSKEELDYYLSLRPQRK